MLRFVYLSLTLLVIIFGIVFAVLNAEDVQLNYYLGSVELPLSLVLVLAMILGALLGIFASVEVAEKEIVNLRNIPIKDEH